MGFYALTGGICPDRLTEYRCFSAEEKSSNFSLFEVENLYDKPCRNRFSYGNSVKQVFRHLIFGELDKFRRFGLRTPVSENPNLTFSRRWALIANTVYLERAANALRNHGQGVDDALLQYLSPLGWEHINRFRRINFLKAKSVMLSTFLKLMLSHA